MKNIAVIGFGWLGKALYHYLKDRYLITVFSRNCYGLNDCTEFQLETSLINNLKRFEDIIYTIPLRNVQSYKEGFARIIFSLSNKQNFYFISSTSVYSGVKGYCDERTSDLEPTTNSGKLYLEYEYLIEKRLSRSTVIRSGGHFGRNRFPLIYSHKNVRHLENKYVNYIHAYDLIRVIDVILKKIDKPKVVNAVSPNIITRDDYLKIFNVDNCYQIKVEEDIEGYKVLPNWLLNNNYNFLF